MPSIAGTISSPASVGLAPVVVCRNSGTKTVTANSPAVARRPATEAAARHASLDRRPEHDDGYHLVRMTLPTLSETVFTASELRKNRKALDAARERGAARVRDADGASLIVVMEGTLGNLVREHDVYATTSKVSLRLRRLEDARASGRELDLGDWRWLRHLDDEDWQDFVADMWEALAEADAELSVTPIAVALEEWHETARALADRERHAKLTAPIERGDFVEIAPQ